MIPYRWRALVPKFLKSYIRGLAEARMLADWESLLAYRRAQGRLGTGSPAEGGLVEVRLRALAGVPVWLRAGTTDATVLWDTFFHRFHLPLPGEITESARLIVDLGANAGFTMVSLAARYPSAKVVGVELDPGNAEACRRNTAAFKERCEVIQAALWFEDGELQFRRERGHEDSFSVMPIAGTNGQEMSVKALSLNSLLNRLETDVVDYLKMDIEGAEMEVLRRNTEWASRVQAIKVETHGDYSREDCSVDLQRLGFTVCVDENHNLCVRGRR